MQNLFIIESPFQLVNAIEAREKFKVDDKHAHLLIISATGASTYNQILKVLDYYSWSNFHIIQFQIESKGSIYFNTINTIRKVKRLYKNIRFQQAFIGDVRSHFSRAVLNYIDKERIYVLDDGNASILFINNTLNRDHKQKTSRNRISQAIYSLFDIDVSISKNIIFFTQYYKLFEDKEHSFEVIPNQFSFLREALSKKKICKEILFLGNNTPELKYIDQEVYLKKLSQAFDFLFNKYPDVQIYYVPHRREDSKKIELIHANFGVEIKQFEMPFELALITSKSLPIVICSFFSTALETCDIILKGQLKIYSFHIDSTLIAENFQEKVNHIYRNYENTAIKLIKDYN